MVEKLANVETAYIKKQKQKKKKKKKGTHVEIVYM